MKAATSRLSLILILSATTTRAVAPPPCPRIPYPPLRALVFPTSVATRPATSKNHDSRTHPPPPPVPVPVPAPHQPQLHRRTRHAETPPSPPVRVRLGRGHDADDRQPEHRRPPPATQPRREPPQTVDHPDGQDDPHLQNLHQRMRRHRPLGRRRAHQAPPLAPPHPDQVVGPALHQNTIQRRRHPVRHPETQRVRRMPHQTARGDALGKILLNRRLEEGGQARARDRVCYELRVGRERKNRHHLGPIRPRARPRERLPHQWPHLRCRLPRRRHGGC